jgi:hypothetical protein
MKGVAVKKKWFEDATCISFCVLTCSFAVTICITGLEILHPSLGPCRTQDFFFSFAPGVRGNADAGMLELPNTDANSLMTQTA